MKRVWFSRIREIASLDSSYVWFVCPTRHLEISSEIAAAEALPHADNINMNAAEEKLLRNFMMELMNGSTAWPWARSTSRIDRRLL